jgi:phosphotransferase system enzyme I (PtsI)
VTEQKIFAGLGVGLNSVVGEVFKVAPHAALPPRAKSSNPNAEVDELRQAIAAVASELAVLGERAGGESSEIFEALTFLLEDEELFEIAESHIADGWNAASAYAMAVDEFGELIGGDPTFAERVADLQDLSKRVQAKIAGIELSLNLPTQGSLILVGEDFSPADTAQFTDAVKGVVTTKGGPTSHTSIICRSRNIPAVVSCPQADELENGESVLVDPVGDRVVIGGTVSDATAAIDFVAVSEEPIIAVRSNIGTLADAETAAKTRADGVGLFRTELLYLSERSAPSVEQQTEQYAKILTAAPNGPIVVRTIDAGSDKPVPFLNMGEEENPALGVRGYRLIVEHRSFIESQLISLEAARQSSGREVWVMAPMIATVQEASDFCALAKAIGKFKVGIMVETPSIAAMIGDLKGIVDFVSVGTNDLSQYLFAADRMNPALGTLLTPWQPALIRTLARIADSGKSAGISVGVCGESASDPTFAIVLAGLGISSVSASASQVDVVAKALSSLDLAKAKEVANLALSATSAEAAKAAVLAALAG